MQYRGLSNTLNLLPRRQREYIRAAICNSVSNGLAITKSMAASEIVIMLRKSDDFKNGVPANSVGTGAFYWVN